MKQTKQRVVALDYFRGICILVVLLNHSMAFSLPFAYLGGASALWTSAAEMFLLLSGLTFGVVRASSVRADFWVTAKKTWRRAANIYFINIIVVVVSLLMALLLTSHNLRNDVLGDLPSSKGLSLLGSILTFSYGIGWASFLAYYSVFLIIAPFALYILRSRYWASVPFLSLVIFIINADQPNMFGRFSSFALWQIYFVLGIVIARFRLPVISWMYGLKQSISRSIRVAILSISAILLAVNIFLEFNLSPGVARLAHEGFLPIKVQAAYIHLLNHKTMLDLLLMDARAGILRPAVTLAFLASAYLLYQRHKAFLLARTGKFVNTMGRDTLWIFVAQAFAIPLVAALPIKHGPIVNNLALTAMLVGSMYAITQRRRMFNAIRLYFSDLKYSFYQAKYAAIYRQSSDT